MLWSDEFLHEVTTNLHRLGARACPSCGNEDLQSVNRLPFAPIFGEVSRTAMPDDPARQLFFLVAVECQSCGQVRFFNSERHRDGDTEVLVPG